MPVQVSRARAIVGYAYATPRKVRGRLRDAFEFERRIDVAYWESML
jgi:hypothetical protein